MTRNKRGRAKNGAQKKSAAEMVVYRGPIRAPSGQPQMLRTVLKTRYTASSSSAGYMEAWETTGQATGLPEFANFAPTWREYRVLGIRHEYVPFYDKGGYPGTTIQYTVGGSVSYHGPTPPFQGAVTSGTDLLLWQYDGARPWHPCDRCVVEWRMQDIEEAQFFSTSTSYQSGGVYTMVPTLTASRNYGTVFVSFLLEFKGRV